MPHLIISIFLTNYVLYFKATELLIIFIRILLIILLKVLYNRLMGKKGVLLDNGKVAQSSMALYWKAGQKKGGRDTSDKPHEEKQENIEDRAGSAMDRWKLHKEKMISKLYTKPEKKDAEAQKKEEAEKQQRMEEQMERDLLQKELNKNKPVHIPGFKGTNQLQSKREYEKATVGNQETNKLVLPAGFGDLTQEDIVQMLREKKAKKELQRSQRQKEEKTNRIHQIQNDFLMNRPQPKKEPLKEEVQEKLEQKTEEKSIFKSQLLQKIEKGQSIIKKQQPKAVVQLQKDQEKIAPQLKFIPRALWNK